MTCSSCSAAATPARPRRLERRARLPGDRPHRRGARRRLLRRLTTPTSCIYEVPRLARAGDAERRDAAALRHSRRTTRSRWAASCAGAVGYLHRKGWLHLDLKPDNLIADGGRLKLIDFSIAQRPGRSSPAPDAPLDGARAGARRPRQRRPTCGASARCCARSGRLRDCRGPAAPPAGTCFDGSMVSSPRPAYSRQAA